MSRWEYAHMIVEIKGFMGGKLGDDYITELNELAREGWAVDQVIPLQIGAGTTSSVVFLLKRER
ncbi:MAG: DUF4177 domain-containing protein [Chloroflexia bacterium]|nr:DUF4177 domain-containing protein [Chloroflexia bacterium]